MDGLNWIAVALAALTSLGVIASRARWIGGAGAAREGRIASRTMAILAAAVSAVLFGYFMLGQQTPAMRILLGAMLGVGVAAPGIVLVAYGTGRPARAVVLDALLVVILFTAYGALFALT